MNDTDKTCLVAVTTLWIIAALVAAFAWHRFRGSSAHVTQQNPAYRSRYYFQSNMTVRRAEDSARGLDLGRPIRVLVYMQFDTNKGYEKYTVAINRQYCLEHGHTFVLVDANKYADLPPYWRKVFLLRDLILDESLVDIDYVMWMDSDAAFTSLDRTIDSMLHPDPRYSLHVGMDEGVAKQARYRVENRWANAGVFLVRRDAVGRAFADAWVGSFVPSMWCKRGAHLADLTCRKRLNLWASKLGEAPESDSRSAWSTASRWSWDNYEQNMMTAVMSSSEFARASCVYECPYMSCPDPEHATHVLHMYAKSTTNRVSVFRAMWAIISNARQPMDVFTGRA